LRLKNFSNLRLNILEVLGRGAFGEVAVVFDDWERKYYALKTIMVDSGELQAQDALQSALEEVSVLEAATRLQHPNISCLVAHDSQIDEKKTHHDSES
jgi:serine/threonine protein kinase